VQEGDQRLNARGSLVWPNASIAVSATRGPKGNARLEFDRVRKRPLGWQSMVQPHGDLRIAPAPTHMTGQCYPDLEGADQRLYRAGIFCIPHEYIAPFRTLGPGSLSVAKLAVRSCGDPCMCQGPRSACSAAQCRDLRAASSCSNGSRQNRFHTCCGRCISKLINLVSPRI